MKIQFQKITQYNLYPFNNPKDNFKFIGQLLKQDIDPPSLHKKSLNLKDDIILSSNLKRAKECIKTSNNSKIIYLAQLNEIKINLSELCSFEQWEQMGSKIIREKFKEAFIQDSLAISREQIYKEAKEVFNLIAKNKATTIVSHTFRLILLKAIYETNGEIIKKPQLINNYVFYEKPILKFNETFYLDSKKLYNIIYH